MYRKSGCAALDLAYVAAGRYDGYFQKKLNLWDIAAGLLLVQEAGGITNDINLKNLNNIKIIATNSNINKEFQKKCLTFNCFKKIFCYKTGYEKKYSSKLSQNQS